jgi:integrase
VDFLRREVRVRQQLQYGKGFYLARPKTKSSVRTVEMSSVVGEALARQLAEYPAQMVEILDRSDSQRPQMRTVQMLFTSEFDRMLLHRGNWARRVWVPAVASVKGVPAGFGMHGLRHYYATLLIHAGASVKTVQLAMGHATPTTTLNEYTHEWPDLTEKTRSIVDRALGAGDVEDDGAVS